MPVPVHAGWPYRPYGPLPPLRSFVPVPPGAPLLLALGSTHDPDVPPPGLLTANRVPLPPLPDAGLLSPQAMALDPYAGEAASVDAGEGPPWSYRSPRGGPPGRVDAPMQGPDSPAPGPLQPQPEIADGAPPEAPQSFFGSLLSLLAPAAGPRAGPDLVRDSQGNILAPGTVSLIDEIAAAGPEDEPDLRQKIEAAFRGEPRTAYWFHAGLADRLEGATAEETREYLAYFGDERLRSNRRFTEHLAGLGLAVAPRVASALRPAAPLRNEAVQAQHPRKAESADPAEPIEIQVLRREYEAYDRSLRDYERELDRLRLLPPRAAARKRVRLNNRLGRSFEPLSIAVDRAEGYLVGKAPTLWTSFGVRRHDHTRLDEHGNIKTYVDSKARNARTTRRQALKDQELREQGKEIFYATEAETRSRARRLLGMPEPGG